MADPLSLLSSEEELENLKEIYDVQDKTTKVLLQQEKITKNIGHFSKNYQKDITEW